MRIGGVDVHMWCFEVCVYVDVHSGMNKRMWYFEVCVWCGHVF